MTFPAGLASLSGADPLVALRAYRPLAPWSLRDLAALAGALLEASNIVPVNAVSCRPPSGVARTSMGVSISRKPRAERKLRTASTALCRISMFSLSGRRRKSR